MVKIISNTPWCSILEIRFTIFGFIKFALINRLGIKEFLFKKKSKKISTNNRHISSYLDENNQIKNTNRKKVFI